MRATTERLERVFDLAYGVLRQKINGGLLTIDNEASLQLHFSAILKVVGDLFEIDRNEHFSIELEKPVALDTAVFGKSGSKKAKIDICFGYKNDACPKALSCAIELKYFKRENHREPNNRYDVFADLKNLESYGEFAELGFMIVATDHEHYVSHMEYSPDTCDFDFRDQSQYTAGKELSYRTLTPYGKPITLSRSYKFEWDRVADGTNFLKIAVLPAISPHFVKLFADEPAQWGLRGDQPLWQDMAQFLVGVAFPATSSHFRQVLESAFRELTGFDINHNQPVLVAKYSLRGMSSGQVDPAFWREQAIPLLTSRFLLAHNDQGQI